MGFLSSSFRVGRLFGITIHVHFFFVLFVLFELFDSGSDWQMTATFLTVLFGTVLLHELGHCFGARAVGGYAENILMWPLGGLAYAHAPMRPWEQFVTVAAGPAVNLAFVLVSGAIWAASYPDGFYDLLINPFGPTVFYTNVGWLAYVFIFYQVNLLLLCFNLLPVYPMDGGQLFQCVLWPFLGLQNAMRLACQVGLLGCVGLGLWGLSEDGGSLLVVIALFGGFTCFQRLQMLKYGMVVDERVNNTPYRAQNLRRQGAGERLFGGKRKPQPPTRDEEPEPPELEPSPEEQRRRQEEEVDRILKKVHERGLASLSYVERQVLERASRR